MTSAAAVMPQTSCWISAASRPAFESAESGVCADAVAANADHTSARRWEVGRTLQIDALAARVQRHTTDCPQRRNPQNRRALRPAPTTSPAVGCTVAGRSAARHGLRAIAASGRELDAGSRGAADAERSEVALDAAAGSRHVTHGDLGRTNISIVRLVRSRDRDDRFLKSSNTKQGDK